MKQSILNLVDCDCLLLKGSAHGHVYFMYRTCMRGTYHSRDQLTMKHICIIL